VGERSDSLLTFPTHPTLFPRFREWRINFLGKAASSAGTVRPIPTVLAVPHLYPLAVGHIAESCSSDQRLCYNCRQPGHESSACPSPRTVSAKQCYSCGGVGHIQGSRLSAMEFSSYLTLWPSGVSQPEDSAAGRGWWWWPEVLREWCGKRLRVGCAEADLELWPFRSHCARLPQWCPRRPRLCFPACPCRSRSQYGYAASREMLSLWWAQPYG
jgi:hypothetical protein